MSLLQKFILKLKGSFKTNIKRILEEIKIAFTHYL